MRKVIFTVFILASLIANSDDSLSFNFETENIIVSNCNLCVSAQTDKQKFLNISFNTVYDNIPLAINDIPVTGNNEFSIKLQKIDGMYYLSVLQKNCTEKNEEYEKKQQWLFLLPFPEYCKKVNSVFIENGATGNSVMLMLEPSSGNSTFVNISQVPCINFQLFDKQEEKKIATQKILENPFVIHGVSNKISVPLTADAFPSIFKDQKFSLEANLRWVPSKDTTYVTYTINNTNCLFYKIDKENSIVVWPDPSVSMIDKQTKQTEILVNGIKYIKEKTIFTIPYITINMQKLSGPALYFIYPYPKQFYSYAPKLNLSIQIIRFENQK